MYTCIPHVYTSYVCNAYIHMYIYVDDTPYIYVNDMYIYVNDMYTCVIHVRPTQSIMYVPLQVNIFEKIISLIVQYKYLQSCSRRFYCPESDPPHKIMRYDVYYSAQLSF